jgi:hypothetical protein
MRLLRSAAIGAAIALTSALFSGTVTRAASSFPQYDHVFLILDENLSYSQVIGSPDAPEINALAADYGIATHYTGVGDPSEPNYVGMLGGSTFGITDDNPYFWPGHTVNQPNLMSQLEAAGKTWKAYLQGIPYAGYRGYCYPAKCLGIPDADVLYRAKHNGIVNFADMQTSAEFAKQVPYTQFATDLASGNVPNFSYIIPDECHDIHGAPPFCTDNGKAASVDQNWLVATGDAVVGSLVGQITSSSLWQSGNNAIVLTSDEGNNKSQTVATVVITSHGPRGVKDNAGYDHYSLLASLEATFGLGCLQNACAATPMTPLFQVTGSTTVPALPAPFTPPPNGSNSISPMGGPVKGSKATLSCASGWQQVPSPASAAWTTTSHRFPPRRRPMPGRSVTTTPPPTRTCSSTWPSTGTARPGRSTRCPMSAPTRTHCSACRSCRAEAPGRLATTSTRTGWTRRLSSTGTAARGR